MARLTNQDLHSEIKLVKNDIEYLQEGQAKLQADITMIIKVLLDPDNGLQDPCPVMDKIEFNDNSIQ